VIPGLTETDEVVQIRKLHHDLTRKELFFAIILRSQHSLTICKVDFSNLEDLKVSI